MKTRTVLVTVQAKMEIPADASLFSLAPGIKLAGGTEFRPILALQDADGMTISEGDGLDLYGMEIAAYINNRIVEWP